jgi:hypothetical protein
VASTLPLSNGPSLWKRTLSTSVCSSPYDDSCSRSIDTLLLPSSFWPSNSFTTLSIDPLTFEPSDARSILLYRTSIIACCQLLHKAHSSLWFRRQYCSHSKRRNLKSSDRMCSWGQCTGENQGIIHKLERI